MDSFFNQAGRPSTVHNVINKDENTQVLVIGAGILGLTAAYCLKKSGREVILLDNGLLFEGENGKTTLQITHFHQRRYAELTEQLGHKKAQLAVQSHKDASRWIISELQKEKIQCSYREHTAYLSGSEGDNENLIREYHTIKSLRLPSKLLPSVPLYLSAPKGNCIKFSRQSQCSRQNYVAGIAGLFTKQGGKIFTGTLPENISRDGAFLNGYFIKAENIVLATDTPFYNAAIARQAPFEYKTYRIGVKIPKGILPYASWSELDNAGSACKSKPFHYAVLESMDENFDLLICDARYPRDCTDPCPAAQERERFDNLIRWTRLHFAHLELIEAAFETSLLQTQNVHPLPQIGRIPGYQNRYTINGDTLNDAAYGSIGGLLISDLINNKKNKWEKLYSPLHNTTKTKDINLKELSDMSLEMSRGWLTWDISQASDLPQGEGKIISSGIDIIALYRDSSDKLHSYSGICPHCGDSMKWNHIDKTFDCSTGDSRFTPFGKVLKGPADIELRKNNFKV